MKFKKFRLTKEGEEYLQHGLPEKHLVELLEKKKSIKMGEAKNTIKNFNIALQWAKKHGWVKIESDNIIFVKKPHKIEHEDALKNIASGKDIDKNILKILIRRKLVEEIKENAFTKAKGFIGKEVTNITEELIKTGVWKRVKFKPYNIKATGKKIHIGKQHPYNRFLSEVRQKLVEMGFEEMKGTIIELEFWNFDALFQAQNHPSRDWTQTYSMKNPESGTLPNQKIVNQVKQTHENGWKTKSTGWGYKWDYKKAQKLMPRAHTTALSARTLASSPKIPGKYFAIARCFRPDVIDATHGVEFNQCEGIVIDESLSFKELLGLLKDFAVEFAGAEKVKFLPDYYPFTEPSVQLSAKHPHMGWVEFAGAGIFREEVTLPLGIKEPVIAWGLGIDRIAMFKLGITDIRDLFTRNLKFLREKEVI